MSRSTRKIALSGQSLAEYGLALALVACASIGALTYLGGEISTALASLGSTISGGVGAGIGGGTAGGGGVSGGGTTSGSGSTASGGGGTTSGTPTTGTPSTSTASGGCNGCTGQYGW